MRDITELRETRAKLAAARKAITTGVEARGASHANPKESEMFRRLTEQIETLNDQIEEAVRAGLDNPTSRAVAGAMARATNCGRPGGEPGARIGDRAGAGDWASRAADVIWRANNFDGETRAITASSIDLPALVLPQVVPMERPKRVIDLLVDRAESPSNAFEFWQQTTRTNNAAMTADFATKPTSTFTVTPVEDRLRVLAHLSEDVPNRLWLDYDELRQFLITELYQGLLDALEEQVLNGDGTGENFEGILHASGTTAVAFDTDVPTTLRGALSTFETSGVQPTGWVLNPTDAAALDLLREGGTPDLFVLGGGYQNGPANSANIFGDVPRLVSPRVPAGKALLADWTKVRLFTRGGILTMLDPFSGFATNTTRLRSEMRIGMGLLRPSAFAVIALSA
ncbi:phage major capsid protein [Mycobacterium paraffinicum]|uniref:Phage capsid-like C-terminal domain-containing protein n=1 Tax=Mycobacterium paraffinicum TaxID=53378 RepID=A0ABP8F8F5_9MYCO|nr:phage major capsid protein [Mycobacterium paraffinicum]MCV7309872.1 phage major capsid protein [Mycobacterium paraffinicum]